MIVKCASCKREYLDKSSCRSYHRKKYGCHIEKRKANERQKTHLPEQQPQESEKQQSKLQHWIEKFHPKEAGQMKKRDAKNLEKVTGVQKKKFYWKEDEQARFAKTIRKYGKNWSKIIDQVGTRNRNSVILYALRLKRKLQKGENTENIDLLPILCGKAESNLRKSKK